MAKGLGKGINALFGGLELQKEESVQEMDIHELRPNPYQPRKVFKKEAIEELRDSIIQHGILQPIVVRKSIKGYEIVVGERRFRAAKEAEMNTVPVIVRDLSEKQMMELALLENLQREDLTPIEEAMAYQMLMKQLNFTQEQLASRLGKSRPHIANQLRLLNLPESIQDLISDGQLSMGHGRALLSLKNKENITAVAHKALKEGWNVRQLEQYITQLNEDVSRETKTKPNKDIFIKETEAILRESLGTSVTIKQNKSKGKIEIEFFSKDDLERLIEIFQGLQVKDQ
ncbi:MAG TPA: ParB/RepB/Spo0J family partition protein [Bacillus sp. (in: firmicutes)]|nr:ParB/RepB/Spo0J family partition protein [Bacillus sp. (in: firmicutes)]